MIVKADNGTYGMGIMTVRDAKDVVELNRRTRNKMSVVKDGQEVSRVIIQEGVPTYEQINEAVAEPVVYMIDRYVVGGFTGCMLTAASTKPQRTWCQLCAAGLR